MEDYQAYNAFPKHRKWFNKLYVSEKLKYNCGPSGIAPKTSGYYIVRPIYNLSGRSVNASKVFIQADDYTKVPPGYFWCEWFNGEHISASYSFVHDTKPYWKPLNAWKGYKNKLQFTKWERTEVFPKPPRILNELSNVPLINIEFIGDKVIEIHLRDSPDPEYDIIVPVWANNTGIIDIYRQQNYQFVESYEDADGFLNNPRIGFMVKNKEII